MKVKAVIMRPDHTNDVVKLKPKQINGRVFRHNDCTYFLHPDRFQVTWDRMEKFGFKTYYATYYYKQGVTMPLPVPDFKEALLHTNSAGQIETVAMENGGFAARLKHTKNRPDVKIPVGVSVDTDFMPVVDQGIKAEELAAIFNPWFYRTIAAHQKDTWEQIQFYCILGIGACNLYLIYLVSKLPVGA